ncbi:hypothetical protein [Sphingomonas asaccharolytica]|uniref:linalool dehydratase/isomerase domain-containing protein n=1 Tax=Sphingomonas asaccharolytica TaxID=40681 RepID=UPI00082F0889|nr:hypothetical protein [Sphingomonas asaccharolytica]
MAFSSSARRQRRALLGYSLFCTLALGLRAIGDNAIDALALGLAFPGVGFLHWADGGQTVWVLGLFVMSLGMFGAALATWFATGNVVLPPLVWLAAAVAAMRPDLFMLDDRLAQSNTGILIPALLMSSLAARGMIRPHAPTVPPKPALTRLPALPTPSRKEILLDDLKRLRLLTDRALQPIEAFDGFEWRDQFQTAAVRYQVNFTAYALAVARRNYLPAMTAWLGEAQAQLLAKQGDSRLWRHWALENAWGNLRLGRDPIPRGNIMSTGFVALQMAIGDTGAPLDLRRRGASWRRYGLDDMGDILARQYRAAPFGLLSCEPNWIYPLCNLITACGLRAADHRTGSAHWPGIAARFGTGLVDEFTTSTGDFVPFRSSLTGVAAPGVGGAVMQTFPCLFLNALYPELAEKHWERVRCRAEARGWRRALWPIDVGNYGFTRAAGYTASAAAAVEMGDAARARNLLDLLDMDCPGAMAGGVPHRPRASLWAHALELIARLGCTDGFRGLIESPTDALAGPHLADADYPEILVASARREGEMLRLVLHPGAARAIRPIAISGLKPARHYRTGLADQPFARADETGRAVIAVPLHGRTELRIVPVI